MERKRARSREARALHAGGGMAFTRMVPGVLLAGLVFAIGCSDEPPALIGSWREEVNVFAEQEGWGGTPHVVSFFDNGTVISGSSLPGSYTVDGDRVTMVIPRDDAGPFTKTTTFYANDTHLVLHVLTRDDASDGVVGTWRGGSVENDVTFATTVTLRADQTGRYESSSSPSGAGIGIEATWEQQGGDVALRAMISDDQLVRYFGTQVDGVLGRSYERLAQ